jgi:hypothetical protein
MTFLDGIVSYYFKNDEGNNTIFYPWGIFGKGYIIEKDNTLIAIKSLLKSFVTLSIPAICFFSIGIFSGFYYLIIVPVCFLIIYYFLFKRELKALKVTNEKLSLNYSFKIAAKSHTKKNLWLMLIVSAFISMYCLISLFILQQDIAISMIGAVLFTAGTLSLAYMIRIK